LADPAMGEAASLSLMDRDRGKFQREVFEGGIRGAFLSDRLHEARNAMTPDRRFRRPGGQAAKMVCLAGVASVAGSPSGPTMPSFIEGAKPVYQRNLRLRFESRRQDLGLRTRFLAASKGRQNFPLAVLKVFDKCGTFIKGAGHHRGRGVCGSCAVAQPVATGAARGRNLYRTYYLSHDYARRATYPRRTVGTLTRRLQSGRIRAAFQWIGWPTIRHLAVSR